MTDYSFIVDGIRFSYSSTSTFQTCPYSFKLTYLESVPRADNFYAEYGTLVHETLERFFKKELEAYQLSDFYDINYELVVKSPEPPFPMGAGKLYRDQGKYFFDNFNFPIDDYDVLGIEEKIDFTLSGIDVVAKPDLVLKNKETQKTILYDYKTAMPFRTDKWTGKEITDTKKINGYYNQMYLYTYALREHRQIPIDGINLWFTRASREVYIDVDSEKEKEAVARIEDIIKAIKMEKEFPYNNTNPFFCDNLCSVRKFCEYH